MTLPTHSWEMSCTIHGAEYSQGTAAVTTPAFFSDFGSVRALLPRFGKSNTYYVAHALSHGYAEACFIFAQVPAKQIAPLDFACIEHLRSSLAAKSCAQQLLRSREDPKDSKSMSQTLTCKHYNSCDALSPRLLPLFQSFFLNAS